MKKCPFCAEEIQNDAIKCKHCAEWLGKDKVEEDDAATIATKQTIVTEKTQCLTCGSLEVYKVYTEDGGFEYWCPQCNESIKSLQFIPISRPWVRYWARKFDYFAFIMIIASVGYIISPSFMDKAIMKHEYFLIFVTVFIWNFIEAGLLSTWGTTPGKWLLKVSIRTNNDNKLNYQQAFSRAISVWFYGLGMLIPLVSFFTLLFSADKLSRKGITTWDKKGEFIVSHSIIGPLRIIAVILFFLIIFLMNIIDKIANL